MSSRRNKNADTKPYMPWRKHNVVQLAEDDTPDKAMQKGREQNSVVWPFGSQPPLALYIDNSRRWTVQVWEELGVAGTPWEGTLRVAIQHYAQAGNHSSQTPILSWDTIQWIKDTFWSGRLALEIYPPTKDIVNVAAMRWIWVLPEGIQFPLNLQGKARAM